MRSLAPLALLAACYSPNPPTGAPCAADGVCPTGLVCSPATQTCELVASDAAANPDGSDGVGPDGVLHPDAPPGCYGVGLVVVCPTAPINQSYTLTTDVTLDTTTSSLCIENTGRDADRYCVIAAIHMTLDGKLEVHGSKPLVLLAKGSITVSGTLDVASYRGGIPGAGANASGNAPECVPPEPANSADGGAGGSFGTQGGDGGDMGTTVGPASSGVGPVMRLRAGCAGGRGGANGGLGGAGGGAVYLIAGSTIEVPGTINASGAGGGAGGTFAGGGGGGSGGMIGFDAPTIITHPLTKIFANGGGGGEGGDATAAGAAGTDPTSPSVPAPGGTGAAPNGGNGGNGATSGNGTTGRNGDNSGGGGGGGGGVIKVYSTSVLGGDVMPPPS